MFPSTPQFVNPIKKVGGYVGNVFKEAGDFGRAWSNAYNASADSTPGANQRAAEANIGQKQAMGQLIGAVVQGRRYNSSGKQITK